MDDMASPAVNHTVIFENDKIRVVRYRFDPHGKVPQHPAPNLVAIYLTDADLQLVFSDGRVQNEKRKAGDAVYLPAGEHTGENRADAPLEFIAVQLK